MASQAAAVRPPVSYWVVTGLGLLWNLYGAYLYLQSKLDPQAALAAADPALRAYALAMPLWAHIGWSIGIWASLAGSLLMAVRSRHAVGAFLLSLFGAAASFAGQALAGVLAVPLALMIAAVIAFLCWFCRNEARKGTLR